MCHFFMIISVLTKRTRVLRRMPASFSGATTTFCFDSSLPFFSLVGCLVLCFIAGLSVFLSAFFPTTRFGNTFLFFSSSSEPASVGVPNGEHLFPPARKRRNSTPIDFQSSVSVCGYSSASLMICPIQGSPPHVQVGESVASTCDLDMLIKIVAAAIISCP